MTLKIEEVEVAGDVYYRAEEGTETLNRVKELDRIGDAYHRNDELIPAGLIRSEFIRKRIYGTSLLGKIFTSLFVVDGIGEAARIRFRKNVEREIRLQQKEHREDTSSYIAYLQKARGQI
jgi:hypothetical protein